MNVIIIVLNHNDIRGLVDPLQSTGRLPPVVFHLSLVPASLGSESYCPCCPRSRTPFWSQNQVKDFIDRGSTFYISCLNKKSEPDSFPQIRLGSSAHVRLWDDTPSMNRLQFRFSRFLLGLASATSLPVQDGLCAQSQMVLPLGRCRSMVGGAARRSAAQVDISPLSRPKGRLQSQHVLVQDGLESCASDACERLMCQSCARQV